MRTEKYNGWTNRSTWLVNLWAEPETQDDLDYIKEALEDQLAELPDGILKDMVDLGEINWTELASHLDPETEEETQ